MLQVWSDPAIDEPDFRPRWNQIDGTVCSVQLSFQIQTFTGLQHRLHLLSRQEPETAVPQPIDCNALCLGESGETTMRIR